MHTDMGPPTCPPHGSMPDTLSLGLLLAPCALILLYPLAMFVMLARFYRRTTRQLVQCMLDQVALVQQQPLPERTSKRRKRRKHKRC